MGDLRARRRRQVAALGTLPALLGLGLWFATLWLLVHGALADVVPARVVGMRDAVVALPVAWSAWWAASWPALVFAGGVVALEASVGLCLALALPRRGVGACFALALLAWPLAAPPDVIALIQSKLAPLAFAPLRLDAAWLAWASAALVDVWRFTPLVALLVFAAARAPAGVLHAADLDGLSRWQRLRHVHLPRVRTALAAAVALRVVDALGAGALPRPYGGDLPVRLTAAAWRGGAAVEALASVGLAAVLGGVAYWLAARGRTPTSSEGGET